MAHKPISYRNNDTTFRHQVMMEAETVSKISCRYFYNILVCVALCGCV